MSRGNAEMRARAFPVLAALLLSAWACATGGMGATGSRDMITAQDIVGSSAQTAYEAVQRLQPMWLTSRGSNSFNGSVGETADVYVGGVNMGGVAYLRSVQATDVKEMRFYDAGQAAARFGMGHHSGVIELTLKGGE